MSTLNVAILQGNIGSEIYLTHLKNGTPVCSFDLATNRRWRDKSGELHEATDWHRIVVWGKQGEGCKRVLSKGRNVTVHGKIVTRMKTLGDGSEIKLVEIHALSIDGIKFGFPQQARRSGEYPSVQRRSQEVNLPSNNLATPVAEADDEFIATSDFDPEEATVTDYDVVANLKSEPETPPIRRRRHGSEKSASGVVNNPPSGGLRRTNY